MDQAIEGLLVVGLAWMAFKALLTVLLVLGAGPVLRRTPLAPLVMRVESHPLTARLRPRLPWSGSTQDRAEADTDSNSQASGSAGADPRLSYPTER